MIASLVASCTWLEAIKSLILSAQILLDYRLKTHHQTLRVRVISIQSHFISHPRYHIPIVLSSSTARPVKGVGSLYVYTGVLKALKKSKR